MLVYNWSLDLHFTTGKDYRSHWITWHRKFFTRRLHRNACCGPNGSCSNVFLVICLFEPGQQERHYYKNCIKFSLGFYIICPAICVHHTRRLEHPKKRTFAANKNQSHSAPIMEEDLLPEQTSNHNRIIQISIKEKMKTASINYPMSVTVGRFLPDVCDGLV